MFGVPELVGIISLVVLLVIFATVIVCVAKKSKETSEEEAEPSSSLDNPSIMTLTSSYNMGLGLWTAICVGFSNIFGYHSKMYDKKVKSVTNKIKKDLKNQMESYSSIYEFGDIRITSDKSLSFVGLVTGKLKNK